MFKGSMPMRKSLSGIGEGRLIASGTACPMCEPGHSIHPQSLGSLQGKRKTLAIPFPSSSTLASGERLRQTAWQTKQQTLQTSRSFRETTRVLFEAPGRRDRAMSPLAAWEELLEFSSTEWSSQFTVGHRGCRGTLKARTKIHCFTYHIPTSPALPRRLWHTWSLSQVILTR